MKLQQASNIVECPDMSALAWDDRDLIDVPSGRTIGFDGTVSSRSFLTPYPFDRALCTRSGDTLWTLAYENRGTKAVLFKNRQEHRELNRSYYFAKAYDYPIALGHLSIGRAVIVHCPNAFNVIECEDAESGEILWTRKTDGMEFHSRLSISPNGGVLLSAGWFWHPFGGAWLCSLADDSGKPDTEVHFSFGAEIDSAAFLDDDHVVVSSTGEVVNEEIPNSGLGPMQLGVWSISNSKWVCTVPISATTGTRMPWRDWVISFYEHPKAIELATGKVAHVWDHIYSGRQIGSIEQGTPPPPRMALNPSKGMFALREDKTVHIVSLHES
jgi:hypothetical protein